LAESGNQSLEAIKGYKLIQLIGKGGFGEVYLAQHNTSGKYVALKVMLPGAAVSQSAVDRFMREIEYTKALQHPNLIQLLDSGFFEGGFICPSHRRRGVGERFVELM
jgi:serine/threonine protein kinase